MGLEEGLYSYLVGITAVTALVGTRLYPVVLPQGGPLPALTYRRTGTTLNTDPDLEDDPLYDARIEITAWGADYSMCKQIMRAVRTALLSKYRGDLQADVQGVSWDNEQDVYDEEVFIPGVQNEFTFTYSE